MLSRKCRAFALNNDKMTSDNDHNDEDLNNKVTAVTNVTVTSTGPGEDLEFECSKPDLSQIIRSLDTPPPSS